MYTITKEEHQSLVNALSELKYKEAAPFLIFFDKKMKDAEQKTENNNNTGINNNYNIGLTEGWTREIFIVKEKTLNKLKDLSATERKDLEIITNEAFETYLEGKKIIKEEEPKK